MQFNDQYIELANLALKCKIRMTFISYDIYFEECKFLINVNNSLLRNISIKTHLIMKFDLFSLWKLKVNWNSITINEKQYKLH